MDPVLKIWMFQNWLEDQKDKSELAKNHAYLVGSFWNPEAVRDLMDKGNTYESSDEDFEESINLIKNNRKVDTGEPSAQYTRKRRTLRE